MSITGFFKSRRSRLERRAAFECGVAVGAALPGPGVVCLRVERDGMRQATGLNAIGKWC
jgi:hypothetical protein